MSVLLILNFNWLQIQVSSNSFALKQTLTDWRLSNFLFTFLFLNMIVLVVSSCCLSETLTFASIERLEIGVVAVAYWSFVNDLSVGFRGWAGHILVGLINNFQHCWFLTWRFCEILNLFLGNNYVFSIESLIWSVHWMLNCMRNWLLMLHRIGSFLWQFLLQMKFWSPLLRNVFNGTDVWILNDVLLCVGLESYIINHFPWRPSILSLSKF